MYICIGISIFQTVNIINAWAIVKVAQTQMQPIYMMVWQKQIKFEQRLGLLQHGRDLESNKKNRRFNLVKKHVMASPTLASKAPKHQLSLPKINYKQPSTSRPKAEAAQLSHLEDSDQLLSLDQWKSSLPAMKRKRTMASESILFLYKTSHRTQASKFKQTNSEVEISSAGLYLAQVDAELAKVKKINYHAIYQNVEYCAGVYQIAFNDILKKLDSLSKSLQYNIEAKLKVIEQIREMKIAEMLACRVSQERTRVQEMEEQQCLKSLCRITEYEDSNRSEDSPMESEDEPDRSRLTKSYKPEMVSKYLVNQIVPRERIRRSKKEKLVAENKKIAVGVREVIEEKEEELKPLRKMLDRVQQARIKVLKFSLGLGYDIREQGLVWILKQLNEAQKKHDLERDESDKQNNDKINQIEDLKSDERQAQKHVPKISSFPCFLTEQEISFLIRKYKNNFKLKILVEEKHEKHEEEKAAIQAAYENIRRDANRKLSMIRQKELLERTLRERQTERTSGHKYLNAETLKLLQESQKVHSTANELVYQETVRKLNRYCLQEIYARKPKQPAPSPPSQLMQEARRVFQDTSRLRREEQQIRTQEEHELADILVRLRAEIYEGRYQLERRDPITVVGCLVGWRRAKKILETELNIVMVGA